MADIIQLLPDHVANQIAAGEVVQRPASVVKELLENAIDAKSDQIKLVIQDAGKTLIQVIDNGIGMSPTDARMSFERHATSKIKTAADLFKLKTKGFRGEALASIAAVAQVELKTSNTENQFGTHLKIEGNEIIFQEPTTTSKGTNIAVRNLFYNIPARRKFLKSDAVETRHIINEFHRVALAHPQISFSFFHNGKEIYNLLTGNLRKRIVAILGKKANDQLVPIAEKTDLIEISGFVSKIEFAKRKKDEQFFFVNNRFIKSPYLNHAVQSAYENLIANGLHPSYFLFLSVNSERIDINIHPTKTEIKFDDEKTIYAILKASVKHSLGQYQVAPILDFERNANLDTPYYFKNKVSSTPKIEVDPNFNPFKTQASQNIREQKKNIGNWESLYSGISSGIENEMEHKSELFQNELTEATTFQIHKKFVISSIKSGVVIIHQNLAHQRILYEEFLEKITVEGAVSQQLLFPLEISFNKEEIKLIKEIKEDLENCGFQIDQIFDDKIVIKGIPSGINEGKTTIIIEQLLADIQNDLPENSFSQLDSMAKSLAKSTAVKTGQYLNAKEQEELVNKLFLCKQPESSPYGKKTFITINLSEIDNKF
ncbi:MAG: DNA mismatch repair endonuclease MutL [Lutibacter sp.]